MQGKTRIWIGMILLFISGIAVGFFGSGMIIRKHVREFVERGPAHMNARVVHHALRGMDLTDEQRTAVDDIIEETMPELTRLSSEFGDSIETAATRQFDSIKALLNEEQVKVLEDRIEEIREMMKKRRSGRRGRGPGRGTRHEDPGSDE
ncbi:MAG: hypothetical protein KAU49_08905 [Candidatus Krumholzibacteria bacterium]|nr:hypothetical protein [Candidatus Krumholzibacteria bacterium]